MKNITITTVLITLLIASVAMMVAFSPITHATTCSDNERHKTKYVSIRRGETIRLESSRIKELMANCPNSMWYSNDGEGYVKRKNIETGVVEITESASNQKWDTINNIRHQTRVGLGIQWKVVLNGKTTTQIYSVSYIVTLVPGTAPSNTPDTTESTEQTDTDTDTDETPSTDDTPIEQDVEQLWSIRRSEDDLPLTGRSPRAPDMCEAFGVCTE